jgi:hypothetical protein
LKEVQKAHKLMLTFFKPSSKLVGATKMDSALAPTLMALGNALFANLLATEEGVVRCALSDSKLRSRMPLDPTHVHLKQTRV